MSWNLASVRDHNVADPIGGLGPRVEREPTPAPAPVVRPDGIVVHPDGKLSTELPLPEGHPDATPTPAPFYIGVDFGAGDSTVYYRLGADLEWDRIPAKPEPGACLREPLKAGDRVRLGGWYGDRAGMVMLICRGGDGVFCAAGNGREALILDGRQGRDWERA